MSLTSLDPPTILLAGVCAVTPPLLFSGALTTIGFTTTGVVGASFAAAWMSSLGNVPAGSLFAVLQSKGAIGLTGVLLSSNVVAFESAAFFSALYGMKQYSIDGPTITGFASDTSSRIWDAQKSITEYVQEYYQVNHPDAGQKIHLYLNSAEAHMSSYFSAIRKQELMNFVSKHSREAIHILDESTRIHRESLMKTTSSLLSTLNSQETADLVRKYSKESADKALFFAEDAMNTANSYLSTINTQENVDLINKKSKEALHALGEKTRAHRENIMRTANSYLPGFFRQTKAE